MKKLMIAAAALCMSASAMAEWIVVEQTESGAVMQENALGVSFAVQQVAASGTAPIADIATEYAKKNNCAAPTAGTMSGFPVQHVVCPDATQVFILDDGEAIGVLAGKCESEEQCAAIDSLVATLTAKAGK